MLPIDWECPDCEIEMESVEAEFDEDDEGTIVFECPDCGYMTEFYEDEDGETYANDIY